MFSLVKKEVEGQLPLCVKPGTMGRIHAHTMEKGREEGGEEALIEEGCKYHV